MKTAVRLVARALERSTEGQTHWPAAAAEGPFSEAVVLTLCLHIII